MQYIYMQFFKKKLLYRIKPNSLSIVLSIRVRPAVVDDARIIAEIHYAGWQLAYSSISSADQMAAKLPERRVPFWQSRIAEQQQSKTHIVLIAEDETGKAQGFAHSGDVIQRELCSGSLEGYDCEIFSLHCRASVQGKGLGRLLMRETVSVFRERGRKALVIWAYRDNAYRSFYEKLGGKLIAEGIDDGIPDIAYGWSLSSFA